LFYLPKKETMQILTENFHFSSKGHTDIINLTDRLENSLQKSGIKEGQLTVFSVGSTTGITTLEYEPGLVTKDVAEMFDQIAPYGKAYKHNQTWGDNNGAAHLRSALTGTSFCVPFSNGQLALGTWQQVVFIDFDTRPRNRQVIIQIIGQS
jgi:secondary thiamine-phosphate synthase enzyme